MHSVIFREHNTICLPILIHCDTWTQVVLYECTFSYWKSIAWYSLYIGSLCQKLSVFVARDIRVFIHRLQKEPTLKFRHKLPHYMSPYTFLTSPRPSDSLTKCMCPTHLSSLHGLLCPSIFHHWWTVLDGWHLFYSRNSRITKTHLRALFEPCHSQIRVLEA